MVLRAMGAAFLMLAPVASWAMSGQKAAPSRTVRAEMLVSSGWLAGHLHDKDLVVICVAASPTFYSDRHIPGARLLRLQDITITRGDIPNELPPADQLKATLEKIGITDRSRIVLYGERYNLLAARAYFTLDYLGLAEHAALLDGGIEKWRAEVRPESKDVPDIKPSSLKLGLRPEILKDLHDIRATVERSPENASLIDARPHEEFSGDKLSEDVPKKGHIPTAKGLYWMDLLVSREDPVLKPEADLRRMFEKASAGQNQLITYCRTGMQSSFDYFVAKYLGYDTAMYDSSYFEWSHEDLPVETATHD
jgi:thiosulfate/3-mercaptopyruvate sulfurtransferase